MQTRQLYASVTGSSQLYFDVPSNARIKAVIFTATTVSGGAGDTLNCEVSTASTNQTAVNDAVNVCAIASFQGYGAGTPATAGMVSLSFYCPSDIAVKAGDRIYLNYTEVGTATWLLRALVFFA